MLRGDTLATATSSAEGKITSSQLVRRSTATLLLTVTFLSYGSLATNASATTTLRHRNKVLVEDVDGKRSRYGNPEATKTKLVTPTPSGLPKLAMPPVQPLARLIRVRFAESSTATTHTCANGNVVLNVPTRLSGAQRRAAVRQAIRQEKLSRVPDVVSVAAAETS